MMQLICGLLLYLFLALPPVARLLESIMIIHMHMQMPLLVVAGWFMARYLQMKFPRFFEKWNGNGIPGILLFIVVSSYWTIPRTMDEALTIQSVEIFKFVSLPFLAGIPLRDSWKKLSPLSRNVVFGGFTVLFFAMGWLYIATPVQLCNNYLLIEQVTLGWGFLSMAVLMAAYLVYDIFLNTVMAAHQPN